LAARQNTARAVIEGYKAEDIDRISAYRSTDCTHRILSACSAASTKVGLYANEYAQILTFTEDGRKVNKSNESVDSAYSQKFVAALTKEK
jgi:hypothetical protein